MKNLLTVLSIILSLNGFSQQNELTWHTDVNKAINLSIQEEKPLFFFFTGSDWCGWCIKLQQQVFFKKEFKAWADKNVILVELDFPRRKKLDPNLKKQNQQLAQMFGVRGYPIVWFVTPVVNGQEIDLGAKRLGSQGFVHGGVNVWIDGANKIIKQR